MVVRLSVVWSSLINCDLCSHQERPLCVCEGWQKRSTFTSVCVPAKSDPATVKSHKVLEKVVLLSATVQNNHSAADVACGSLFWWAGPGSFKGSFTQHCDRNNAESLWSVQNVLRVVCCDCSADSTRTLLRCVTQVGVMHVFSLVCALLFLVKLNVGSPGPLPTHEQKNLKALQRLKRPRPCRTLHCKAGSTVLVPQSGNVLAATGGSDGVRKSRLVHNPVTILPICTL